MKFIKYLVSMTILSVFLWACGSSPINKTAKEKEEPVVIANDSLEYEVIILDPGFNFFLNATAQPRNFYSQNYLETRNRIFVTNWNIRAQTPSQFNTNIYENIINYEQQIDYGYEVNYLLFNYFMFAQRKYNMSLASGFRSGRIN
ncbi:MAG: DUF6146 family protein [Polaribacter sp.]